MKTNYIGKPVSRVDGADKVTGKAKYAAEYHPEGLVFGYVVNSRIAKGTIEKIDSSKALATPGVLQVFTHENVSGLAWFNKSYGDLDSPSGTHFRPLHSEKISHSMQPVALVVAESFELARHAASLVEITYKEEPHVTNLRENLKDSFDAPSGKVGFIKPKSRGNAADAYEKAEVKISSEYVHSAEHHNPMEMFASTAVWESDDKITIYDKTQGIFNCQTYVSNVFGLSAKNVRILAPYVGGGFGSGLRPQYQLFMAVLAALELKRPVRVVLTRQQMFSFGHRPSAIQKVSLGASADGQLQSIDHQAYGETSQFENYTEIVVNWSGMLYECENVELNYELVKLDVYTPLDMRAPGSITGNHALESAMDELSYALKMDPLELRLKNYTEEDPFEKKPYSSKQLRACYTEGAEKFGWDKRSLEPRSMREGNDLIGWGMATGAWDASQMPAKASAVLSMDGTLYLSSGTTDIGTGTYTIMTQIAAESLGITMENVKFELGDTEMPEAPLQGGSWTAASVGSAVKEACDKIRKKLLKSAKKLKGTPLYDVDTEDLTIDDGFVMLKSDNNSKVSITELMQKSEFSSIAEDGSGGPSMIDQFRYSFKTHAAVFAEVKVDEDLGTIIVSRVVCAVAAGKILNPKTAGNQVEGAVVWGISKALEEETMMDDVLGRYMNHSLAEYHVAVNKDINDIEVIFVEEQDDVINPLGIKGVGEIGIVAVAGAIANAVYHATGVRVRSLPITMDKVLQLNETH
jgi:xanthine dehydrogenase YagR molybdenum-binding subunit